MFFQTIITVFSSFKFGPQHPTTHGALSSNFSNSQHSFRNELFVISYIKAKRQLLKTNLPIVEMLHRPITFSYQRHIYCSCVNMTWTINSLKFCLTLSALEVSFTKINLFRRKRRGYKVQLLPVLQFLYSPVLSASFCKFYPLDEVFSGTLPSTDHTPFHFANPESEIEAQKIRQLMDEEYAKEAARKQAIADAEQEWDDDFADLTLFIIFGELLIFMVSAYRRSSGW